MKARVNELACSGLPVSGWGALLTGQNQNTNNTVNVSKTVQASL